MTENQYLLSIINKYIATQISDMTIQNTLQGLLLEIQRWANRYLLNIYTSGSRAKGTAIKGNSDIDFLISLSSTTPGTLCEIYESLYSWLNTRGYQVRKQNVSLGITYYGYNIDLVPARKQSGHTNYHSLYCRKRNSWMQTNIQQHINHVINSGRTNEIKIVKIWAKLHKLDFPSIYLEHIVIDALKGKIKGNDYLGRNVMTVFQYIVDNLLMTRVIDISNSNNIISNDLTQSEKTVIINKAKESKQQKYWENIVW